LKNSVHKWPASLNVILRLWSLIVGKTSHPKFRLPVLILTWELAVGFNACTSYSFQILEYHTHIWASNTSFLKYSNSSVAVFFQFSVLLDLFVNLAWFSLLIVMPLLQRIRLCGIVGFTHRDCDDFIRWRFSSYCICFNSVD
jgi:hypothetical protein